jgi:hypothetical protein
MKIITDTITIGEIKEMAANLFGDMVKVVVDVERGAIAIDAELHSDLEALLLDGGSKQKDLWGINIYPELSGDEFIEFDSLINIRPARNNKSRDVGDKTLREKIAGVVAKKVKR